MSESSFKFLNNSRWTFIGHRIIFASYGSNLHSSFIIINQRKIELKKFSHKIMSSSRNLLRINWLIFHLTSSNLIFHEFLLFFRRSKVRILQNPIIIPDLFDNRLIQRYNERIKLLKIKEIVVIITVVAIVIIRILLYKYHN